MSKWICILEDDEDIREIITFLLTEGNYKVSSFANVADFVTRNSLILPDLFLLDVLLPDGSGIDVCKKLKSDSLTQNVPVLMMSAHANKNQIFQDCNANGFIAKPFDIDYLLNKVENVLSHQRNI